MTNFEDMSPESRVWIYQTDRMLSEDETRDIKKKVKDFTDKWTAHNEHLRACGDIFYNHFIILMADETTTKASGCSIDSSVNFIKELENEYNLHLMDRLQIAYKSKNNKIFTTPLDNFRKLIREGVVSENTLVFNNLVETKDEFEKNWLVPVKQSWHQKLLESNVKSI